MREGVVVTGSDELLVAPQNEGQAAAWDGDEGARWAANPDFYDRAATDHHARLLAAAAIGAAERVLDLGCGTGQTTRDAARSAGPGAAVGIDLSTQMTDLARRSAAAEGLANATFIHGDAQIYPFDGGSFDVAISRFGTMFFGDQVAAFANVHRALRSGGRLAMLSWQAPAANEWFSTLVDTLTLGRGLPQPPPGTPGPFTHADPRAVRAILADAGFGSIDVESLELPVHLGFDAADGFERLTEIAGWMMEPLDDGERRQALDGLRAAVVAHQTPDGVAFGSASWLITATATGARRGT
jgi:ubiquinone/menaquinone biosynthesis C-methylase UbiE